MDNKTFNFKYSDLRYDTTFEFFISGDYSISYREIEEMQLTTHSPVIKLTILLEGLTETPELVSLLNNEESAAEHVYSKIFQEFVSRKPELNCSSKNGKNRHVLIASVK